MEGLKEKTLRGGLVRICGQGANFLLRFIAVVALARLLDPKDFGLVAMVTVVTGAYERFTSAGLSAATVQRANITEEQVSALFWVNILVGVLLSLLCLATAPALVKFYNEPRLFWITVAVSAGFLFNAAGVQHFALLQRQLRYVAITAIEASTQFVGICVGVAMAVAGFGYWSLVGAAVVAPAFSSVCAWFAAAWSARLIDLPISRPTKAPTSVPAAAAATCPVPLPNWAPITAPATPPSTVPTFSLVKISSLVGPCWQPASASAATTAAVLAKFIVPSRLDGRQPAPDRRVDSRSGIERLWRKSPSAPCDANDER